MSVHTHGKPVAVANDVTVLYADGSNFEARQVSFHEGGWCIVRSGDSKDILPRERIQAVMHEEAVEVDDGV